MQEAFWTHAALLPQDRILESLWKLLGVHDGQFGFYSIETPGGITAAPPPLAVWPFVTDVFFLAGFWYFGISDIHSSWQLSKA